MDRLASLPKVVEGWRGRDGAWKSEIVTAIGAEDWLLRRYQNPSGSAVWLYVGFHNNVSFAGSSPHSPLLCYPGQGWVLIENRLEEIPLADGSSIPVNHLLVQKGSEQRLVLYWFQWGDEVTTEDNAGDYLAKLGWLLRLPFLIQENARTDRSLVRVSARVRVSRERTFESGASFVRAIFPLLAEHFELAVQRPST
jgi:EpsI family protein